MVIAFLGLGSNLGNRKKNITRALCELEKSGQIILKVSSIYETEPHGCKEQRKFLNAAVKIKTSVTPHDLLAVCKKIEKKLGRKKTFRWGPRTIDLDILFYSNKKILSKNLKIPHPELHRREFVLKPLKEIAPRQMFKKTDIGQNTIELGGGANEKNWFRKAGGSKVRHICRRSG